MRTDYAPHVSAEKLREGVVGGSLHVVSHTPLFSQRLCYSLPCPPLSSSLPPAFSHAQPPQGRMHIDRLDARNGSIVISSSNQTLKIMGRRSINRAVEGDTGQSLRRCARIPLLSCCVLIAMQWPCVCCRQVNGAPPPPATLMTATTRARPLQRQTALLLTAQAVLAPPFPSISYHPRAHCPPPQPACSAPR
jgi:hypothetical protein